MPKVSVVTAVYNGGKYLEETLRSILDQTFDDFEYVLVDDGSTDNSVEIIRSIGDPRIRLFVNDQNRRLVYTRNRGIAEARGEFIALTDHDDISLPTRFAEQVRCLDANPAYGLVATWYDYINLTGVPVRKRAYRRYAPEECKVSLLYRNLYGNSTLMIRRTALPDPPYAPEFPLCEDYDFIAQVAKKHPIWMLPEVLVKYRLTTGSYSNFVGKPTFDLARVLKRRLLVEMGVEPTERELDLHHSLETNHEEVDLDMLREMRIWLERLVAANERSRVYEPRAFAAITGNEWFELCRAASWLGSAIWPLYHSSSLAPVSHYGHADRLKLFVKCVLGNARRAYAAAVHS
ncbi:MAG TPA: glycosyltransferase [Stellaceae bacterium]|nr:glycosyltransferase [Stellaceae bacterium]